MNNEQKTITRNGLTGPKKFALAEHLKAQWAWVETGVSMPKCAEAFSQHLGFTVTHANVAAATKTLGRNWPGSVKRTLSAWRRESDREADRLIGELRSELTRLIVRVATIERYVQREAAEPSMSESRLRNGVIDSILKNGESK
jgi:hypothetical protein